MYITSGAMMLSSEMYRYFTKQIMKAADDLCHGKVLFTHEGGYSKDYVVCSHGLLIIQHKFYLYFLLGDYKICIC